MNIKELIKKVGRSQYFQSLNFKFFTNSSFVQKKLQISALGNALQKEVKMYHSFDYPHMSPKDYNLLDSL